MLLFLLSGFLLLRLAARRLFVLVLFHEPPRNTRALPGVPTSAGTNARLCHLEKKDRDSPSAR